MFKSIELMQQLDELRAKKKMKIKTFNQGIVSTRNYSRYMSGQYDVPYKILNLYLEKLDISIWGFFIYVYHQLKHRYKTQLEFIHAVKEKQIADAFLLYHRINFHQKSEVSDLLVPLSYQELLYISGQIPKEQFIRFMMKKINIERIFDSKVISREELDGLFMVLEYGNTEIKKRVIEYLVSLIIDSSRTIVSLEVYYSKQYVALSIIKYFSPFKSLTKQTKIYIKQMFRYPSPRDS